MYRAHAAHDWQESGQTARTYEYDLNGNIVDRDGDTLTYDPDNRLTKYDKAASSDDTEFVYDADGTRILRIGSAATTTYIGGVYETDGTVETAYYTFGGETVALRVDDGTDDDRYWLISDHLGSAVATVDASDNTSVSRQLYHPYGEPRGTSSVSETDRLYTGQTSDTDETGLLFYNARYYDPALRRFAAADTIVPDPANPQAFNRYSYVHGNPLKYSDPSGHDPCIGGGAGCYHDDRSDIWQYVSHSGSKAPENQIIGDSAQPQLIVISDPSEVIFDYRGRELTWSDYVGFGDGLLEVPGAVAELYSKYGEGTLFELNGTVRFKPLYRGSAKFKAREVLYGATEQSARVRMVLARGAGRSLQVLSVPLEFSDAMDVYSGNRTVEQVLQSVGRTSLSLAGGVAAGTAGFAKGGAAGTALCGPVCGGIGAVAGGAGAALVGSGTARWLWDKTVGRL